MFAHAFNSTHTIKIGVATPANVTKTSIKKLVF